MKLMSREEHAPTEQEVRRHAVTEGLAVGAAVGIVGVMYGGHELTKQFLDEETVEVIEHGTENQQQEVNSADWAIYSSPIILGPLVAVGVYKYISNMVRRKGGSPYVGYREQPVSKK